MRKELSSKENKLENMKEMLELARKNSVDQKSQVTNTIYHANESKVQLWYEYSIQKLFSAGPVEFSTKEKSGTTSGCSSDCHQKQLKANVRYVYQKYIFIVFCRPSSTTLNLLPHSPTVFFLNWKVILMFFSFYFMIFRGQELSTLASKVRVSQTELGM